MKLDKRQLIKRMCSLLETKMFEFWPETDTGYEINNNEAGGKRIGKIFLNILNK